ncbi:hypothetical protein T484DRAFT_1895920, partial [Baffinella frigidus]
MPPSRALRARETLALTLALGARKRDRIQDRSHGGGVRTGGARHDGATQKLSGTLISIQDAHISKETALDDTKSLMDHVKSDQLALVQALRGKGEENEKQAQIIADKDRLLKRQEENEKQAQIIADKDRLLKRKEVKMLQMASLESEIRLTTETVKMLQMASLESEIQSLKADNLLEKLKMQAQHKARPPSTQWASQIGSFIFVAAKTGHFEKDVRRIVKLEADNESMTHRIAQLESELNKAKTSYSVIHFHDQLAKTQRLELHYRTKTKQGEEMEAKIKALEKRADINANEAEQAREKYKKLFEAVQKQSQLQSEKVKNMGPSVTAKAEELSVSYYKDLVIERDIQIVQLKSRIKHLSTQDKRSLLANKRNEDQQSEISRRMAMLQARLDASQSANQQLALSNKSTALLSHLTESTQIQSTGGRRPSQEDTIAVGRSCSEVGRSSSGGGSPLSQVSRGDARGDTPDTAKQRSGGLPRPHSAMARVPERGSAHASGPG